jgi:hypothetical protein
LAGDYESRNSAFHNTLDGTVTSCTPTRKIVCVCVCVCVMFWDQTGCDQFLH